MKTKFLAVFLLYAYCAIYAEELLDVPFIVTAENKIAIPAEVNGVSVFFQFDTGTVSFLRQFDMIFDIGAGMFYLQAHDRIV